MNKQNVCFCLTPVGEAHNYLTQVTEAAGLAPKYDNTLYSHTWDYVLADIRWLVAERNALRADRDYWERQAFALLRE